MQWTQYLAGGQRFIGQLRLGERAFAAHGNHGVELWIDLVDACVTGLDHLDGGDLFVANHLRNLAGILRQQFAHRNGGKDPPVDSAEDRRGAGDRSGSEEFASTDCAAHAGLHALHRLPIHGLRRHLNWGFHE